MSGCLIVLDLGYLYFMGLVVLIRFFKRMSKIFFHIKNFNKGSIFGNPVFGMLQKPEFKIIEIFFHIKNVKTKGVFHIKL